MIMKRYGEVLLNRGARLLEGNSIYSRLLIFILAVSVLPSCIDKFTPSIDEDNSDFFLVVEGMITDEEGPFKIYLTKSEPVDQSYSPKPCTGADVIIIDS